jgi:hypothetical protein
LDIHRNGSVFAYRSGGVAPAVPVPLNRYQVDLTAIRFDLAVDES